MATRRARSAWLRGRTPVTHKRVLRKHGVQLWHQGDRCPTCLLLPTTCPLSQRKQLMCLLKNSYVNSERSPMPVFICQNPHSLLRDPISISDLDLSEIS